VTRLLAPMTTDTWRLLILVCLAAGIRLLYVASVAPNAPIGSVDAWGYHRLALNLEQGNGFSLERSPPFVPDSVRTPLYPLFLLLIRRCVGSTPQHAAFVQAALDSTTVLFVWWIARRLGGPRSGRVAALLYAFIPTQVHYTSELLTETLFGWLIALSVGVLIAHLGAGRKARWRWTPALALLTALAALCKPNALYLPLLWTIALLIARRHDLRTAWLQAGLLWALFFGLLTPWIWRNWTVFGRPFVSTAFEGNLSRVSAPATLGAARGQYVAPWSAEWEAFFGELVTQAAETHAWSAPWQSLGPRQRDTANRQVFQAAVEVLRAHPLAWLRSHALGTTRYLEPRTYRVVLYRLTGRPWPPDALDDAVLHVTRALSRGDWAEAGRILGQERWSRLSPIERSIWWTTLLGQCIGLVLAVRGVRSMRGSPAEAVAVVGTAFYLLWLPGPIAYERFRVPVTGLICVLIGLSIVPGCRGPARCAKRSTSRATCRTPPHRPSVP